MEHFPKQLEPLAFEIVKLKPDPKNARLHSAANLEAITRSLTRWGWRNVIVARKSDKVILAGNGRVEAARAMGWTHAPVVFVADDVNEGAAFAIADNRTSELASWNLDNLSAQLEELGDGMADVGFSMADFEDLTEQRAHPFVTERVSIDALKPHPRNYRQHPADQLKHIQASIRAHGYYRNVVVARDNTILAGHGVVEASRQMGRKRVPVVRLDVDPNEPRALKVVASDNEVVKGGNTTIYQGDGRLKMARSLERVWPYVVTTDRRFKRPQHVVRDNWRRFDTPLKLKPGVDLNALPQVDYGLRLVQAGDDIKSPALRKLLADDGQAPRQSDSCSST